MIITAGILINIVKGAAGTMIIIMDFVWNVIIINYFAKKLNFKIMAIVIQGNFNKKDVDMIITITILFIVSYWVYFD